MSLQGLSCKVGLDRTRVFPDECVELSFELVNARWLPLPWVEIEQTYPRGLSGNLGADPSRYSRGRVCWTTALSGRQRLKWRHPLPCRARGEYRLGPARLRSGDMFGLFPREMIIPRRESLLVYPRLVPTGGLDIALKDLLGEAEAARRLYEDLNRSRGPRDYRREDPFKFIHWKATAKQGRLQVRQFESSTGLSLVFVLDAHSFCEPDRREEGEAFELAVSLAASLARDFRNAGWPLGLLSNASPEIQISASSDPDRLTTVLEALARVRRESRLPLHAFLEREWGRFTMGTTLAVITRCPSPKTAAMMEALKTRGHSLFLVTVGKGTPGDGPAGIPIFPFPLPEGGGGHAGGGS